MKTTCISLIVGCLGACGSRGALSSTPDGSLAGGQDLGRGEQREGGFPEGERTWSLGYAPTTEWLNAVWGSSSTDVWAVGDHGAILHHDGSRWSAVSSPTDNHLQSMWGSSSQDVWAVGEEDGTSGGAKSVIRYQGRSWEVHPGPFDAADGGVQLLGAWGSSSSDVWAVGSGAVIHYSGGQWSKVPDPSWLTGNLAGINTAIWGSSASSLWVAAWTDGTALLHHQGATWSRAITLPTCRISSFWGSSATDIWSAGQGSSGADENGCLAHFDGSRWTEVARPIGHDLHGLWGSSATNIWAVGYGTLLHYDGQAWSKVELPASNLGLQGIWGSSASDIWAVGAAGVVLHYH